MKFKPIDVDWMQKHLELDPSVPSGLRWKIRPPRSRLKAGDPAGTLAKTGYWRVTLNHIACHRVVWAIHHGQDPGAITIDHLDRDKNNNAIENLQAKDWRPQLLNRAVMGAVPLKFVQKARHRFKAGYRQPDGGYRHVGTFGDPFQAHIAAVSDRLERCWHP